MSITIILNPLIFTTIREQKKHTKNSLDFNQKICNCSSVYIHQKIDCDLKIQDEKNKKRTQKDNDKIEKQKRKIEEQHELIQKLKSELASKIKDLKRSDIIINSLTDKLE